MYEPAPKTIVLMLIYMVLVYTTVNAFTISAYDYDSLSVGGSRTDLLEKGEMDLQTSIVTMQNEENLTGDAMWDKLNATYGASYGVVFVWNWLDTGWYYKWVDAEGTETLIIDWKMEKLLTGTLDYDDLSFQESAGNTLGAIWSGIGYVTGFLTFNIVGTTMSDGSTVPAMLQWLPLLMVLIPWIIIILWLLPYLIRFLQAIAELIPL